MFWAVRAAAPRSLLTSASEGGGATAGWLGLLGVLAGGAAGALGALGVLGAAAGAAGTAGAAGAAGALALAEGDAAFTVSAGLPSGMAGCDPVPFPRVGR
jgi:maltooligosyltrehalose trehalohydrolase